MLDDVAFALVATAALYSRTQLKQYQLAYDAPIDFAALFFDSRSLTRLVTLIQLLATNLILQLSFIRKEIADTIRRRLANAGSFFYFINTRITDTAWSNINMTHLALS